MEGVRKVTAGQWLQKEKFADAQVSLNGLGGSYLPKVEKLEIGTIQKQIPPF